MNNPSSPPTVQRQMFYHGTSTEFTNFKPTEAYRRDIETGEIIKVQPQVGFLTSDKNVAEWFAGDKVRIDKELKGIQNSKPIIMEVSVELKNTLDLTIHNHNIKEVLEEYPNYQCFDGVNPITSRVFEDMGHGFVEDFIDVQVLLDDRDVIQQLQTMGFDSVRLKEQGNGINGGDTIAILNPEDIIKQ